MNFNYFQKTLNMRELQEMEATQRLDIMLHALSASWGRVSRVADRYFMGDGGDGNRDDDRLAIRQCLIAAAGLCEITASDLGRITTGASETPVTDWQYLAPTYPILATTNLLMSVMMVPAALGVAHGAMADRLLENDGFEYQSLAPVIKAIMEGLRAVANVAQIDLATCMVTEQPVAANGR